MNENSRNGVKTSASSTMMMMEWQVVERTRVIIPLNRMLYLPWMSSKLIERRRQSFIVL